MKFFVLLLIAIQYAVCFSETERIWMKNATKNMFYYGYQNYMKYAFPHDELKPLSKFYTDSFVELGNLDLSHLPNGTYPVVRNLYNSLFHLVPTLQIQWNCADVNRFFIDISCTWR